MKRLAPLIAVLLLAGCMRVPPVITGIIATNELGLYTVGFHARVSEDAMLVWDMGDGTEKRGVDPVHDYDCPGEYAVTLTATTPHGPSVTSTLEIVVSLNKVCYFEGAMPEFPWACDYPHTEEDWRLR